jgi:hypothetical protein
MNQNGKFLTVDGALDERGVLVFGHFHIFHSISP